VTRHQFFDLRDGQARVQALWANFGAVHDGVATVDREVVVELVESLFGELVTRVDDPPVGLQQHSRAQVLVRVPPVRRTRSRTAGTQNALVEAVQLAAVFRRLEELLLTHLDVGIFALEERLDRLVLGVEVGHVWHQIFDHVHVRQRVDLRGLGQIVVDAAQAGQSVCAVDVHGARAANAFAARAAKSQRWVLFVLDFDESVQDHHA